MMIVHYASKKELRQNLGNPLRYTETSMFGPEYKSDGTFCVTNDKRSFFAEVTMAADEIDIVK